jgi:hypothetical protein
MNNLDRTVCVVNNNCMTSVVCVTCYVRQKFQKYSENYNENEENYEEESYGGVLYAFLKPP